MHVERIANARDEGLGPRMKAIHESLHQVQLRIPGRRGHLLRLRRVHAQRLLAQHMLAGRERTKRPFAVQGVDEWDVDGVHLWVFEHGVVGRRDSRERVTGGKITRSIRIAACDRHEPTVA